MSKINSFAQEQLRGWEKERLQSEENKKQAKEEANIEYKKAAPTWDKRLTGVKKILIGSAAVAVSALPFIGVPGTYIATALYVANQASILAPELAVIGVGYYAAGKSKLEFIKRTLSSLVYVPGNLAVAAKQRIQAEFFEKDELKKAIKKNDSNNTLRKVSADCKLFVSVPLGPALLIWEGAENIYTGKKAKYGLKPLINSAKKSLLESSTLLNGEHKEDIENRTKEYEKKENKAKKAVKQFESYKKNGVTFNESKLLEAKKHLAKIKLSRIGDENKYQLLTKGIVSTDFEKKQKHYRKKIARYDKDLNAFQQQHKQESKLYQNSNDFVDKNTSTKKSSSAEKSGSNQEKNTSLSDKFKKQAIKLAETKGKEVFNKQVVPQATKIAGEFIQSALKSRRR